MERSKIESIVNQIMIEEFEIEPSQIRPQARLKEEFDLDSLDGVDLVVAIERKFGIRIEEEKARQMATLKDIYDYIENHLPPKS